MRFGASRDRRLAALVGVEEEELLIGRDCPEVGWDDLLRLVAHGANGFHRLEAQVVRDRRLRLFVRRTVLAARPASTSATPFVSSVTRPAASPYAFTDGRTCCLIMSTMQSASISTVPA